MTIEAKPVEGKPLIHKITLTGKIYAASSSQIQDQFKKALDAGAKHIVLDCSMLEQVDSTILSTVIVGLKMAKAKGGGKVIFFKVGDHIKRILTLTKMDQFFPIAADEASALALCD